MVSDFVEEHDGFLQLSHEAWAGAKESTGDSNFPKMARQLFKYGAESEGYWTKQVFRV